MGGEREPVQSYLQGVLNKQVARQHRREKMHRQNGRLLDEGILLFGKSLQLLIKHGDRTLKGKPTPPVPVKLDGQTPVFLSVSESFAPGYDAITEGVKISVMRGGERADLFKIMSWGRVENASGEQASPEELEIAEKLLDFLGNS